MRISHITIANHRRVSDLDIEIRDHAVFVGPNASGKSTILRMLDSLLGAPWNQLVASLDPGQLRDPAVRMLVEARLDDLDADDVAHFADKIQVGTGDDSGSLWLNLRLTAVISAEDPDRLDIQRVFVKPLVDDMSVTRDDLSKIGWVFLSANRSPDRDLGNGRTSAVRSLLRAVSLQADEAEAIDEAVADLSEALRSSPSLSGLRDDLADELSELFPFRVEGDDIEVDLPSTTADDRLGDVDVQIRRDGQKHSLSAQSDGLRSLSVVAVQLLASRSARILAIDEPEIHLHPRGQANLGRLLASAPGQRLVATHAPAVLARFGPGHAVSVGAGGSRQLPAAAFERDPKWAEHWWVDSALEPLTADRVILVEGISDRILVHAVARLLAIDLDRTGVTVVPLNGAHNFKAAIRLFGPAGFDVPLLGLVDEAEATIPAAALELEVDALPAHNVLTCCADLEEEYVTAFGVADTIALLIESGLFAEAGIKLATSMDTLSSITAPQLTEFVRHRKHKVEAAAAIGSHMTATQAGALSTVADLVRRAVAE